MDFAVCAYCPSVVPFSQETTAGHLRQPLVSAIETAIDKEFPLHL